MTISRRSKIAVRWSTDPALVGYARTPAQAAEATRAFRARKPDFIGSPRTALDFANFELRRKVGLGICYRYEFTVCATGELVDRWTLEDLLP